MHDGPGGQELSLRHAGTGDGGCVPGPGGAGRCGRRIYLLAAGGTWRHGNEALIIPLCLGQVGVRFQLLGLRLSYSCLLYTSRCV